VPTESLVEIRGLNFAYDTDSGPRKVLEGIDMSFHKGKVVAIMGGSGCGKTTLLRLIGGQLRPSAGEVNCRKS